MFRKLLPVIVVALMFCVVNDSSGASKVIQLPGSQNSRTYKIHDEERLRAVLTEVVEIKAVKNLQSPNFPQDFEIEIKNVSQKPIYLIYIAAILPESRKQLGSPYGFRLSLGNIKLVDGSRPDPTDTPLRPGETGILKPNEGVKQTRKHLENTVGNGNVDAMLSKVVLVFQIINFGDDTGYIGADKYPVRSW